MGKRIFISFVIFALSWCSYFSHSQPDILPVADSHTKAITKSGEYISWKEHIIDDPIIGKEPNLSGSDGLAIKDLDGDGFQDIVSVHEADIEYGGVTTGFVRIAWGSQDPTTWHKMTLAKGAIVAAAEDVAIADANQDGLPDIVVATELAHLIYFQNPGKNARTKEWEYVIPSITQDRGSFIRVYFADFDNDGKPEIVAANKGDQDGAGNQTKVNTPTNFSIFLLPDNPLEGGQWREQVLGKALMPINAQPVDLDQDGDLDVVAGSRVERRIMWFENTGDFQFARHEIKHEDLPAKSALTGFSMDYADIDGDGRLDIITNAFPHSVVWLKQPEEPALTWKAFLIGTTKPDLPISIRLVDVDGDSDVDVFVGGYSRGPRDGDSQEVTINHPLGRIAWFENAITSGLSQTWIRHDVSRRQRGMYDQWLAFDVDTDGDMDMFGTRGNSFPYDGVIWLEQIRNPFSTPSFEQAREADSVQTALPNVSETLK